MPVLMIEDKFFAARLAVAQRTANAAHRRRIGQRPKKQLDRILASQLFQTVAAVLLNCFIRPKDPSIGIDDRHTFGGPREQRRDDLTQFIRWLRNGSPDVSEGGIPEGNHPGGTA